MLIPSTPRRSAGLTRSSLTIFRHGFLSDFGWGGFGVHCFPRLSRPPQTPFFLSPVARRCFPAIQAKKGVIMVGNETTYDDGQGRRRNVTELLEGAK